MWAHYVAPDTGASCGGATNCNEGTMSMPTVHRPLGVGILSILVIIAGIGEIITGIIILAAHGNNDVRVALSDITESNVTLLGVLTIVSGVMALAVGFGLRNGASWARTLVVVLLVVRIGVLIWSVAAHHALHWDQAIIPVAIYAFIASYLYSNEDVKAFFGR